ncbi:hypothetical protein BDC45DRAFT_534564 [Circinella umbellata]|nr:hypothetical protein BDC45DRAFT_534557 [Circinella umbellata]KAI7855318.1 hypothetical protein BDC45DRAFT_534564 [Circinella umbellata]
MMGPCDIKRIDLNQEGSFTNAQPSLIIMVVAPEEKRLDQRITRSVTIKPHNDQHLCPVAASTTYNTLSVLPLRLQVYWCQRVSKHIQEIMKLLPATPTYNHSNIKARALGSLRSTVNAGASVENVAAHGSWSSGVIFNNFYCLSTETRTDFTTLVLGQPAAGDSLNIQSVEPQLYE